MHRAKHVLSLVVTFLLALTIQIDGLGDGSLRTRNRLVKEPMEHREVELRLLLQYKKCIADLSASDLDGDLKISEEEYISFISTRSLGGIDVDKYSSLPFSLISTYVYGSCFCSLVSSDPNCCVGDNAGIGLDVETYPIIENNLVTVCRNTDSAIVAQIGTLPPTLPKTDSPTTSPTATPTESPSEAPIGAPSLAPSDTPTASPSMVPIDIPSLAPSETPTTSTPTAEPTIFSTSGDPTTFPTSFPTPKPTPASVPLPDVACLTFQYGVESDQGFTAEDIDLGINNTIKSDLVEATRDIVIEILNATFSEDEERRALRNDNAVDLPRWKAVEGKNLVGVIQLAAAAAGSTPERRRAALLPTDNTHRDRRLAFYSDAIPPVITDVVENAFCEGEDTACSIVETKVCVVLEEGEDETTVKDELIDGIENAFRDGRVQKLLD